MSNDDKKVPPGVQFVNENIEEGFEAVAWHRSPQNAAMPSIVIKQIGTDKCREVGISSLTVDSLPLFGKSDAVAAVMKLIMEDCVNPAIEDLKAGKFDFDIKDFPDGNVN